MSQVTTHVLDTAFGTPAVGVGVGLDRQVDDRWAEVASGATDADGRVSTLGPDRLDPGIYRLTFATGDYFHATHRPACSRRRARARAGDIVTYHGERSTVEVVIVDELLTEWGVDEPGLMLQNASFGRVFVSAFDFDEDFAYVSRGA